jgi:hypothetical protein
MSIRRIQINICKFCKDHIHIKDSSKHDRNCSYNPKIRSCSTCNNRLEHNCNLGLIPINFEIKQKIGKNCLSWSPLLCVVH